MPMPIFVSGVVPNCGVFRHSIEVRITHRPHEERHSWRLIGPSVDTLILRESRF